MLIFSFFSNTSDCYLGSWSTVLTLSVWGLLVRQHDNHIHVTSEHFFFKKKIFKKINKWSQILIHAIYKRVNQAMHEFLFLNSVVGDPMHVTDYNLFPYRYIQSTHFVKLLLISRSAICFVFASWLAICHLYPSFFITTHPHLLIWCSLNTAWQ